MADSDDGRVSREAFERVTRERDELKAQNTELAKVARDTHFVERAYEVFSAGDFGINDPYAAAKAAVNDARVSDADPNSDDFASQLSGYVEQSRKVFGAATAEPTPAEPDDAPEQPAPESTFSRTPNPAGPGEPSQFTPMVVGSDEWQSWSKNRSVDEQVAAVERGDAVYPQAVAEAHSAIPG